MAADLAIHDDGAFFSEGVAATFLREFVGLFRTEAIEIRDAYVYGRGNVAFVVEFGGANIDDGKLSDMRSNELCVHYLSGHEYHFLSRCAHLSVWQHCCWKRV